MLYPDKGVVMGPFHDSLKGRIDVTCVDMVFPMDVELQVDYPLGRIRLSVEHSKAERLFDALEDEVKRGRVWLAETQAMIGSKPGEVVMEGK